jgi:twitching motility protein PilU
MKQVTALSGLPEFSETPREGSGSAPRINPKPLFRLMAERRASDLFVSPNSPVKIKIEGEIYAVNKDILGAVAVRQVAEGLMTDAQQAVFKEKGEIDYGVSEPGLGRFRVTVFSQRGTPAVVVRFISQEAPRLDQLRLPDIVQDFAMAKRGLVLVVGPTGVGKSTTIAAMIEHRNERLSEHILTIEDPIEFLHFNKQSIVNQREVGSDVGSYAQGLKAALRAAPDVIMIGEIRDRETMEAALRAAGTGQLCIASMHANNAAEAIDRVCGFFPQPAVDRVLLDLSLYLRGIVAQRLLRGKDGRRVAAIEVLVNTAYMRDLIRRGDTHAIKEYMQSSTERGMRTFDESLKALVVDGVVDAGDALAQADSRANLEARLNFR